MRFCPDCGTSLVLDHQAQETQLSCPACPYAYRITKAIHSTEERRTKRPEAVLLDLEQGNLCEINCPECSNREAFYTEFQTRSADEPMTIFYRCTSCRFNWKE